MSKLPLTDEGTRSFLKHFRPEILPCPIAPCTEVQEHPFHFLVSWLNYFLLFFFALTFLCTAFYTVKQVGNPH